jgi:hypothetical protein
VREHVVEEFEKRIASGMPPEGALKKPIVQCWYGKPKAILRVRCYAAVGTGLVNADSGFKIPVGMGAKYLLSDSNAFMQIKADGAARIVALPEAVRMQSPRRGETRIFKGDHLEYQEDRSRWVVSKMTKGSLYLVPETETRNFDELDRIQKKVGRAVGAKTELNKYSIVNV